MCRAQQVGARTGLWALCDGFLEGGLCAALAALSGRPLAQQSISGEISLLLLLQMRQMNSTMVFTGTAGQEFMTTCVGECQPCCLPACPIQPAVRRTLAARTRAHRASRTNVALVSFWIFWIEISKQTVLAK